MRLYSLLHARLLFAGATVVFLGNLVEKPSFAESPGNSAIPLGISKDRFGDPLPRYAQARLGTVRWRHGARVLSVAFHPDGKTLVSAAEDQTIRVWDAATGKEVQGLEGHSGDVLAIAFDRKGGRFAAVTDDTIPGQVTRGQLVVWDYRTGKKLWLQRANEILCSVAFSPDGTTLATGGSSDGVSLWDAKTGAKGAQFPYERAKGKKRSDTSFGEVCFSPDSRWLACGGNNGKGYIWDVASGKKVLGLDSEESRHQVIIFSPDGKRFASVASKERLVLWDVSTRKSIGTIPVSSPVFQFSPDGKVLTVGEDNWVLSFWDVATRRKIKAVKWGYLLYAGGGSFSYQSVIAFSPDCKRLAWAGQENRVHLLDVATGEEAEVSREPHGSLSRLAFSPDGRTLALCGYDRGRSRIYLWDLSASRITKTLPADDAALPGDDAAIQCLAFSPQGRTIATGDYDHLYLWDVAKGKRIRLGKAGDLDWVMGVVFSPDGAVLMSGSQGGNALLWDTKTGRALRRFEAQHIITALALSPNGRLLAAASFEPIRPLEQFVQVWDLTINKEYAHFVGRSEEIRAAAFSPDGTLLAVGGKDKNIRVWEVASWKICLELQCADEVNCLSFFRDGRFLASGGKDQAISLWDLATDKRMARLSGHQGTVTSLAFSPDGKTLATASEDTTALLWRWREAIPQRDKPAAPLAPRELQRYWNELAGGDAKAAYRAIWILATVPEQSVPLIAKHLQPVPVPNAERISQLIAELDSSDFTVREKATRELATLDDLAEPQLRKVVASKPSLETRLRVEQLLERLEHPAVTPEKLQNLRALMVLEQSSTKESKDLLRRLAAGATQARLTRETRAILDRLEK